MVSYAIKSKIGGAIGISVGALSVISGSMVLLGIKQPGYHLLISLVIYNVLMDAISVVAGVVIWQQRAAALRFSLLIAAAHAIVLLLLTIARLMAVPVAPESFAAMLFRTLTWGGISYLIWRKES
ncbi:MAG: hypothetical protein Kow0042_01520 [Calditrichia bacterium]